MQVQSTYQPPSVALPNMNPLPVIQSQQAVPSGNWVQYLQALVSKPADAKNLFDGSPRDFLAFMSRHEVTVATMDNPMLKLQTLTDNVSKRVGQDLAHCQMMDPVAGYERATQLLWQMYGNPSQVRETIIGDLKKGGTIMKSDKAGLLQLSMGVSAAHEVLKSLTIRSGGRYDYEHAASSIDIISDILSRTPFFIDEYSNWFTIPEERCMFGNLRFFLELKTSDALDPLVLEALRKAKERTNSKRGRGNDGGQFGASRGRCGPSCS